MSVKDFKEKLKGKLNFKKDIEDTSPVLISDLEDQNTTTDNQNIKEIIKNSQEEKDILINKIESLENGQDIIFEQFRELELQRLDIDKQQKILEETSKKFRLRTIDLFGKMTDLKKAKKTISIQNNKLEIQQKEINKHQRLLEKSNQKFRERTIELFGKMIDLKKAKKTISIQNTKLEKQGEQLEKVNASKDKFFSIIAHDLRNPIAGFLNLTDILSANFDAFSESENKDFIDVMNQASKQLYNLLENLLQWSRSQTGSMSYEPKIISVKEMVNEAIDGLLINIENKQLKVSIKVDKETVAYIDENMITTVIRNLISNAIKFSTSGESIIVRCTQEDEFIVLAIIDNGVGIKKEDQGKLFKIDKHLTTPGTADEKGSGLGLILCNEFVEKNGGKIWVESEINKGSSFIFTMPKQQQNK